MKGKIVISGASRGIGRAVALKFAAAGFDLALCARTKKDLDRLQEEIANPDCSIIAMACDVSKKEQVLAFADKINSEWGAVDIVFNNAGTFVPGQVINEDEGVLETLIETNLYSAYHLTRALLPNMLKKRKGHIFNMCSVASIKEYPNGGSYSISKFALLGLSKALREELKPHHIRVTALIAGATYTDSWGASGLPEERFMKADDLAQLLLDVYSLSESSVVEEVLLRPMLGDI